MRSATEYGFRSQDEFRIETMKLPQFTKYLHDNKLRKGWTRWLDFRGFSMGLVTILAGYYDIDEKYGVPGMLDDRVLHADFG